MDKGIIYYTDNRVIEPIFSMVQKFLLEAGLPIVSTSLKPIDFGENYVLDAVRSYPTMVRQIIMALEHSKTKYVFFCENDVLYPKSHFDFTPPEDDVFYYNSHVWRWMFMEDRLVTYKDMLPLSCLCTNREFALAHYRMRMKKIEEWGLDEFRSREPRRSRIWGYEPGRKSIKRGGLTNEKSGTWHSELPAIDIRHKRTFSRLKCTQEDFIHPPVDWREITIDEVPGWNLKELFYEGSINTHSQS